MTRSGPAFETSVADTVDWRDKASCAQEDDGVRRYPLDLFFPDGKSGPWVRTIQEAKNVCWTCDVRTACKAWSLETRQPSGIWGGLDEDERAALLRRQSRARAKGDV